MGLNKIPVAKEGYPFILPLILITTAVFYGGFIITSWFLSFLTAFVVFFFRDPPRNYTGDKNVILSPADGRIVKIVRSDTEDKGYWISIFLSVFNVHVNRMPVTGEVIKYVYNPGKFLPAFKDKASILNEQSSITIKTEKNLCFQVKQIAGLIARRIVCYVKEGDTLNTGDRFGLIRFGSRVDIFIPSNVKPSVNVGDIVKGGLTVIARMPVE